MMKHNHNNNKKKENKKLETCHNLVLCHSKNQRTLKNQHLIERQFSSPDEIIINNGKFLNDLSENLYWWSWTDQQKPYLVLDFFTDVFSKLTQRKDYVYGTMTWSKTAVHIINGMLYDHVKNKSYQVLLCIIKKRDASEFHKQFYFHCAFKDAQWRHTCINLALSHSEVMYVNHYLLKWRGIYNSKLFEWYSFSHGSSGLIFKMCYDSYWLRKWVFNKLISHGILLWWQMFWTV